MSDVEKAVLAERNRIGKLLEGHVERWKRTAAERRGLGQVGVMDALSRAEAVQGVIDELAGKG